MNSCGKSRGHVSLKKILPLGLLSITVLDSSATKENLKERSLMVIKDLRRGRIGHCAPLLYQRLSTALVKSE